MTVLNELTKTSAKMLNFIDRHLVPRDVYGELYDHALKVTSRLFDEINPAKIRLDCTISSVTSIVEVEFDVGMSNFSIKIYHGSNYSYHDITIPSKEIGTNVTAKDFLTEIICDMILSTIDKDISISRICIGSREFMRIELIMNYWEIASTQNIVNPILAECGIPGIEIYWNIIIEEQIRVLSIMMIEPQKYELKLDGVILTHMDNIEEAIRQMKHLHSLGVIKIQSMKYVEQ